MDKLLLLLFTILGVLLLSWAFQGFRLYKSYRGDIYGTLYGGFLPYFYRYVVIRDCSESSCLRSQIGAHRIVFSTINNEGGRKTRFCVIFYGGRLMVLCYDKTTGQFRGNASSKAWNILRTGADGKQHIYRHSNPTRDVKAYLHRLAGIFPDVHMEARLAFPDEADLSQLCSDIKAIHFSELEAELKVAQTEIVSDDDVRSMYQKLIKK